MICASSSRVTDFIFLICCNIVPLYESLPPWVLKVEYNSSRLSSANSFFADEILEASITVQGFVLNGTYEGEVLVNHTVVLHQDISGIHEDLETLSDDSGWFTFDEIVFNPQASYAVSVEYQGVLYGQDLDISNGSKSDISLVVYDSSDSADILFFSNASVLISDIDKDDLIESPNESEDDSLQSEKSLFEHHYKYR